jgi:transcriptional regulator with XRE-family HTH domain
MHCTTNRALCPDSISLYAWRVVVRFRVRYCASVTHTEESSTIHRLIGERIKQLRNKRGWSAQRLGEEMARVGIPWNRSIVVNIEQGRRSYITVEELVALGRVLGVPPMLLAFPFDQARDLQVLPNVSVRAWDAAQWFAGRAPFPHWQERDAMGEVIAEVGDASDLEAFEQGAVAVELWDLHARQLAEWRAKEHAAEMARRRAARDPDDTDAQQDALRARRTAEAIVNNLWEIRRRMRQHGILSPELPEVLQHVDTDKTPLHRAIEDHYRTRYPDLWNENDQEEAARSGRSDQAD